MQVAHLEPLRRIRDKKQRSHKVKATMDQCIDSKRVNKRHKMGTRIRRQRVRVIPNRQSKFAHVQEAVKESIDRLETRYEGKSDIRDIQMWAEDDFGKSPGSSLAAYEQANGYVDWDKEFESIEQDLQDKEPTPPNNPIDAHDDSLNHITQHLTHTLLKS